MIALKVRPVLGESNVFSLSGQSISVPEPREPWMGEGHTFLRAATEVLEQENLGRNASLIFVRIALGVLYSFHLSDKNFFLRVITPETVLRLRGVAECISGTPFPENTPDWARPILLSHQQALWRVLNCRAVGQDFSMAYRLCCEMAVEAHKALYSS